MAAPTAKDCHAMTTFFINKYKERHGVTPNVNRHTARWGFESILLSMDTASAKELVEYYFTTPAERRHDLDWFFYNYDKLLVKKRNQAEDKERIDRMMEESKARAEKWRQRGQQGIANN